MLQTFKSVTVIKFSISFTHLQSKARGVAVVKLWGKDLNKESEEAKNSFRHPRLLRDVFQVNLAILTQKTIRRQNETKTTQNKTPST